MDLIIDNVFCKYLTKWVSVPGEKRNVNIKVDTKTDGDLNVTIWVYDYKTNCGEFITSIDEIPTKKYLMEKELERITCKMNELKGELQNG